MDERTCTTALLTARDGRCDPAVHAAITARKADLFRAYTADHKPALFLGVVDFVQQAGKMVRLAVASGGRREQILHALRETPIEEAFEIIVSADDCPIGKPDPAIYDYTLRLLNARSPKPPLLRVDECLVVEDSRAGIQAALRAGMPVLALATTYPAAQLGEATLVLKTLAGADPSQVLKEIETRGNGYPN
ncbi:MAG: HAD family phosphatase [Nitrospiraceae bacterium]